MRKLCVLFSACILIMTLSGTVLAEYKSGYEVVSTTEKIVIIKNKKGEEIEVPATSKKFNIGDEVFYDAEKKKLQAVNV